MVGDSSPAGHIVPATGFCFMVYLCGFDLMTPRTFVFGEHLVPVRCAFERTPCNLLFAIIIVSLLKRTDVSANFSNMRICEKKICIIYIFHTITFKLYLKIYKVINRCSNFYIPIYNDRDVWIDMKFETYFKRAR